MADTWAGISAGVLAGAAGATAHDAVAHLDQVTSGKPSTSSPSGHHPGKTAEKLTGADPVRAEALGPLGGLGIGMAVGAVAGAIRGRTKTPPPTLAALLTGLAAMAAGDGLAALTGGARQDWKNPVTLIRDFLPHLAYGAVTSAALHRMLDPHTSAVER